MLTRWNSIVAVPSVDVGSSGLLLCSLAIKYSSILSHGSVSGPHQKVNLSAKKSSWTTQARFKKGLAKNFSRAAAVSGVGGPSFHSPLAIDRIASLLPAQSDHSFSGVMQPLVSSHSPSLATSSSAWP